MQPLTAVRAPKHIPKMGDEATHSVVQVCLLECRSCCPRRTITSQRIWGAAYNQPIRLGAPSHLSWRFDAVCLTASGLPARSSVCNEGSRPSGSTAPSSAMRLWVRSSSTREGKQPGSACRAEAPVKEKTRLCNQVRPRGTGPRGATRVASDLMPGCWHAHTEAR